MVIYFMMLKNVEEMGGRDDFILKKCYPYSLIH